MIEFNSIIFDTCRPTGASKAMITEGALGDLRFLNAPCELKKKCFRQQKRETFAKNNLQKRYCYNKPSPAFEDEMQKIGF